MTQELYINGERCDLYDKEPIPLIFDSPFFTDINKIVSNRTHSVKIPKTPNNLRLIQFSHRTDNDSKFPYKRHVADYYLNGMEIIRNGCAVLWSIAEDIEIQLVWGNISAFKELLDMESLREIYTPSGLPADELKPDPDEAMLLWDDNTQYWTGDMYNPAPSPYYWARINYGVGREDNRYFRPVVTAGWILDRLAEKKNIKFDLLSETREAVDNLIFPLFSKKTSETSCLWWGKHKEIVYPNPIGAQCPALKIIYDESETDAGKWGQGDFSFFVSKQKCRCLVHCEIEFKTENCKNFTLFIVVDARTYSKHKSQLSSDGKRHVLKIHEFVNLEAGSVITFEFMFGGFDMDNLPQLEYGRFNMAIESQDVPFGSYFPILPNLPDISPSAFLKLLMQITGTFPYVKEGHSDTIHFTSIDTLYQNVKMRNAVDWTRKVLMHSRYSNDPSQMEFKYGSFAQKNRCLWKEDKKIEVDASGYLTVDSEHLEKEKDLLKLELTATEMKDGEIFIPLFTKESDSTVKENEVKPRILINAVEKLSEYQYKSYPYFSKCEIKAEPYMQLSFNGKYGILEKYYSNYQKIIKTPKVIQVKCLLTEYDLSILDLTMPVYFEQFGQYYVILKIQSNNGVSDCELLEIDEPII